MEKMIYLRNNLTKPNAILVLLGAVQGAQIAPQGALQGAPRDFSFHKILQTYGVPENQRGALRTNVGLFSMAAPMYVLVRTTQA